MKQIAQEMLCACGLSEAEGRLIRLYGLHGKADSQDIAAWFARVDFEALSGECVCMAAVMAAENGYAGAPEALQPRLKGIIRYHRMLNSGLYAAMCSMVKEYNRAGIDVLALKGAAIKTGYCPAFVRPMWDVDLLVHEKDYPAALQLACDKGYTGSWSPHSTDLHRGSTENIDLHCVYLRDLRSRKNRDYWPQCHEVRWNEARFFVPERHALLLQLMVNAHTNFVQHKRAGAPLRWIMDIDALLSQDINWDEVIALAKRLQLSTQMAMVVAAYDQVLPGRIDADGILNALNVKKSCRRALDFMLRYHKANRIFRDPPKNCSGLRLAKIHIRWLWLNCRVENPGSALHGLCCFPRYLREELRIKSLLSLPLVAIRKFKKHRRA